MVGERVAIMNTLDLKRQLLALRGFRMPSESDGGNGSTGTSGATSSARGGYGGGNSGGFGMFGAGLGNYGEQADGFTGYNPTTGYATTQVSSPESSNYGYTRSTANKDRTNVGVNGEASSRSLSLSAQVNDFFAENPWARALPFATAVSLAARAGESIGGKYSDADVSSVVAGGAAGLSTQGDASRGTNGTIATTTGSDGASATTSTTSTGTTSSNQDPATLATSIANQSWNDWQGDKAALQTQVSTNTQRGNALYDSATGAANGNMKLVSGMQDDYNSIYRPAGKQYADYVGMLGSTGYQDQQAGRAASDVQQQSDMQMEAAQRNLQRSGVDPSSGRMLALASQGAIGTAAAKAGAANTSRRNTLADWSAGLTKMSDMGNNTLNAAKGLDSSAQSWNTLGLNAGSTGFSQGSDLSKLSGFNAITSGTVAGGAASAIYNQGQLANANAANSRANDAANPWTTIGGAVLTNAAKGIDWGSLFKTSTPVANASNGIDWSTYATGDNW